MNQSNYGGKFNIIHENKIDKTTDIPLVSVIIPTLNSEKYLEKSILSIIAQQYPNIEIIIVDGLSIDNTLNIVKKYYNRINLVISEKDTSLYDAINKGIISSSGEIIKILNSDDCLTIESISSAMNKYIQSKRVGVILGNMRWIGLDGSPLNISKPNLHEKIISSFLHPTWYVHKEIYFKYGLYDLKYRISSDYEMYLRLKSYNVEFIICDNILTDFRLFGKSRGTDGVVEALFIDSKYSVFKALFTFLLRYLGKIKSSIVSKFMFSKYIEFKRKFR